MADVHLILTTELTKLRNQYNARLAEMEAILSDVGNEFPPVKPWLDGVGETIFTEFLQPAPQGLPLSAKDRERCLIALIAERRETLNLAVHIYMGLMNDISPAEVCNVLALTAVYGGISAYIRGIKVAEATFSELKILSLLPVCGPAIVVPKLGAKFATWGS